MGAKSRIHVRAHISGWKDVSSTGRSSLLEAHFIERVILWFLAQACCLRKRHKSESDYMGVMRLLRENEGGR